MSNHRGLVFWSKYQTKQKKIINTLIYKELPICFKVDESNDICSVLKQHIT